MIATSKQNLSQIPLMFTLANLFSSYLMVNCFGDISGSCLKHMFHISTLQENISLITEEKDSESNNDYLPYYLPKVLWVFRDYPFEENEIDSILNKKYEEFHVFLNDSGTRHRVHQQIKSFILDMYKDIDCVMVCKPDFESNRGRKWESCLNLIREKILQKISCKNINGVQLNCRMFCSFVHSIVEELNDNCVPNINNAFEYIIENECILGFNEAIEKYHQCLKSNFENDEVKSMFHLSNTLKVK